MLRNISPTLLPLAVPGLLLLFLITRMLRIIPRYRKARKLGLPIYITPFTWQDPYWMLIYPYFLWLQYLPFGLGRGIKYSYFGHSDIDKGKQHLEVGPVFCIVGPSRLEIMCAEPSALLDMMQKWRVWTKSQELYGIFDTFGKNINTVNGQDWQRHRKITAQGFKEESYDLVWNESRKQASQMLQAIEQRGQTNLDTLREDIALLAMHVLSAAVFGHSYDYGHGLQQTEAGHKLSYFAALAYILNNVFAIVVFRSLTALPDWLLSSYLRTLKLSISEYQQYLTEAKDQEHKAGVMKRSGASLISAMVQANDDEKKESQKTGGIPMHLSDDELYGNMYMFNLAGYETTSFALSFTIAYLAVNPDLQDWIYEEIKAVFQNDDELNYETAFHQLPRCRALMFETLRHHSAAPTVPRLSPSDQPTGLYFHSLDKTITIPPDTYVHTNFAAIQRIHPDWSANANAYTPKRWITHTDPTQDPTHTAQTMSSPASNPLGESLLPEPHPSMSNPDAALFMPWNTGPRVCPGKKFSQVEFVAVVARIFRDWSVEPRVVEGGRSGKDGKMGEGERMLKEATEKAFFNMTPKLYGSKRVGVRWVRREEKKKKKR